MSQDYKLVEEIVADGDVPISYYINRVTGLRIYIAYVEFPVVKVDFTFATEAFDDDGLPHTLEHLIFMGSESYPFKGVLDILANRCFAYGTNALTDTDHTRYTLRTAGVEGFLNLLPIYLDHLLFPTLTESAFLTEVHHIDGNGEDAGIVYCEMQGTENTGENRCEVEMLRSLYPGKCGYKSVTGGLLENLRTSTSNEKCRAYHEQYYRAKNLCMIVTGPVKASDLFRVIKPIEDKIVEKGLEKLEFERPWQSKVPPMDESVCRTVQYPSDTDEDGLVYIGYRGPGCVDNNEELVALSVLLDYLNETVVSPLQREFVEADVPFCSSVSHCSIENRVSCFYFVFESVPRQYLTCVSSKLKEILTNIADGKENFDMTRIETVISRRIVRTLSRAEKDPHSTVLGPALLHFLYGEGTLEDSQCQNIPIYEKLSTKDRAYWIELLRKYMVDEQARQVCIIGDPSPELMKTMSEAEKLRISRQKEALKDQLSTLAKNLESASKTNNVPPPKEMVESIPIPSPDNIILHRIERTVIKDESLPIRIQCDGIKTNFITIYTLLNTSQDLSVEDRLYLPLLNEMIFECPINRDGEEIPYQVVVQQLFSDTVSIEADIGVNGEGSMSSLFSIRVQVEVKNYNKAVVWMKDLLYNTKFPPDRIKSAASKLLGEISQSKRRGSKVAEAALSALLYQPNSNQFAMNFMRQQVFLKSILDQLKIEPTSVQERITRVRNLMTEPHNILVHMSLNTEKIDKANLILPWREFLPKAPKEMTPFSLDSITPGHQLIKIDKGARGVAIGLGSTETNFLYYVVPTITDLNHPDLPAIHVLIKYLVQLEGPLWRDLRGLGLTYSYGISLSPTSGLLIFHLYKCTLLSRAFERASEIVRNYIDSHKDLDQSSIDSAKSTLIFEYINREKNPSSKSLQSLFCYILGLDIDYNKEMIKRINMVTKDDLLRVGSTYLASLFNGESRCCSVCCHPSKVQEAIDGLNSYGCNIKQSSVDELTRMNTDNSSIN